MVTSILEEAKQIVEGARNADYGSINDSFTRIAALWSAYAGVTLDKYDVAKMMMLLKISRLKHNPLHEDSLRDIIGYSICYEKLIHASSKEMDKLDQN